MSSKVIYSIYGLRLRSDLPLPVASVIDDGEVDLIVRHLNAIPRPVAPPPPFTTVDWQQMEQGWLLRYHTRMPPGLRFGAQCRK